MSDNKNSSSSSKPATTANNDKGAASGQKRPDQSTSSTSSRTATTNSQRPTSNSNSSKYTSSAKAPRNNNNNNNNNSKPVTKTAKADNDESSTTTTSDVGVTGVTCICCLHELHTFVYYSCMHFVCLRCAVKMRVLCEKIDCPVCRQDSVRVFCTKRVDIGTSTTKLDDLLAGKEATNHKATPPVNNRNREEDSLTKSDSTVSPAASICFDDEASRVEYEHLLANVCDVCDSTAQKYAASRLSTAARFATFDELEVHVRRAHKRFYCELCLAHLKLLTAERKHYNREQLAEHKRHGDRDDYSHKGHPLCDYCDQRFYDRDELYRHCRKEHYYCHFCDSDGHEEYYKRWDQLRAHFLKFHYMCEQDGCSAPAAASAANTAHEYVVFRTELDLQAHKRTKHAKSKSDAKSLARIHVDFNVRRESDNLMRARRGGANGGGGGSSGNGGGGGGGVIERNDYEQLQPQPAQSQRAAANGNRNRKQRGGLAGSDEMIAAALEDERRNGASDRVSSNGPTTHRTSRMAREEAEREETERTRLKREQAAAAAASAAAAATAAASLSDMMPPPPPSAQQAATPDDRDSTPTTTWRNIIGGGGSVPRLNTEREFPSLGGGGGSGDKSNVTSSADAFPSLAAFGLSIIGNSSRQQAPPVVGKGWNKSVADSGGSSSNSSSGGGGGLGGAKPSRKKPASPPQLPSTTSVSPPLPPPPLPPPPPASTATTTTTASKGATPKGAAGNVAKKTTEQQQTPPAAAPPPPPPGFEASILPQQQQQQQQQQQKRVDPPPGFQQQQATPPTPSAELSYVKPERYDERNKELNARLAELFESQAPGEFSTFRQHSIDLRKDNMSAADYLLQCQRLLDLPLNTDAYAVEVKRQAANRPVFVRLMRLVQQMIVLLPNAKKQHELHTAVHATLAKYNASAKDSSAHVPLELAACPHCGGDGTAQYFLLDEIASHTRIHHPNATATPTPTPTPAAAAAAAATKTSTPNDVSSSVVKESKPSPPPPPPPPPPPQPPKSSLLVEDDEYPALTTASGSGRFGPSTQTTTTTSKTNVNLVEDFPPLSASASLISHQPASKTGLGALSSSALFNNPSAHLSLAYKKKHRLQK